jgi:hypothetical protein
VAPAIFRRFSGREILATSISLCGPSASGVAETGTISEVQQRQQKCGSCIHAPAPD